MSGIYVFKMLSQYLLFMKVYCTTGKNVIAKFTISIRWIPTGV